MITKHAGKASSNLFDISGLSKAAIRQIKGSYMNSVKYGLLRLAYEQFPDRKLFCPVPFTRMEIKRGGKTNLCGWLKKSPGNIHQGSLMRLWNSPAAQEIRGSILDGTFRYCDLTNCPYFASGKLHLQKDVVGDQYKEIIRDRRTKMDTMKLWLSFDHRCNIRCVSCRNSHAQISKEERTENQMIMESVKRDLAYITTLGTSGKGEPFVSPVIRDFLYNFDSSEYPNLKLFILTNSQLLTHECWKRMEKAHQAISSVQVSIDAATKKTYEMIRIGAVFEKLMENLNFLSKLRAQNAIDKLIISFVVNALNFSEMKQFVNMGFEFNCDYVYFAFMSNWGIFTNEEYRKMAVHRPEHKQYRELNEALADPLFHDPRIFIRTPYGFSRDHILKEQIFI
ncbi:MAG: hypothetical protein CVU43_22210 [Chloroflexi bacterium HGW-Chloroflexi-5]|nr:MAG: hypothetical protein CVU55_00240 [Deltaproteobacteria bacterium HGW-Deltaproteobacteria-13]PKN96149.1 MAG: hypothetical protein CVU43_22210 [Chloroflexi bacterium HGW-Chloroflexi-5]